MSNTLFVGTTNKERAILVHVQFQSHQHARQDANMLEELERLADTAGVDVVHTLILRRQAPDATYFVGSGKVQELSDLITTTEADVVIFNHPLSASQERNLADACEIRVLDRRDLILDIFAQRARTYEGKLQVELAQLQHKSTRLVRGRTYLQSQKGGVGMRGPGEMQLETDRRLIRERIHAIEKRLEKVQQQREQGRRARQRSATPTLAFVGYTNAGKSSLFNALTQAKVYVADQLFATLDPTMRNYQVPGLGQVVFADTVGFIRHLPHELVHAFKATLLETADADLLLHIIDASDPLYEDNQQDVQHVLEEIGAGDLPQLFVYNKIDIVNQVQAKIDRNSQGKPVAVWLSARLQVGFDLLEQAICELLEPDMVERTFILQPTEGKLRSAFYRFGTVLEEQVEQKGDIIMTVRLPEYQWQRLQKQFVIKQHTRK